MSKVYHFSPARALFLPFLWISLNNIPERPKLWLDIWLWNCEISPLQLMDMDLGKSQRRNERRKKNRIHSASNTSSQTKQKKKWNKCRHQQWKVRHERDMRAPQASLDWRYLSIWDQNCQLLRRNGVKRRRNTKSKSQTALIYISLVFDIIFVENSLHSLYRTTWAWYLKGRESENANDKSEMFDWYLIRMVLMYISFSSFPFFYSSHLISDLSSTVHVKESRDDMDMAFRDFRFLTPIHSTRLSPNNIIILHAFALYDRSFPSSACLACCCRAAFRLILGLVAGKKRHTMQNVTWKRERRSERNEMTKSLKAIYEWGISFSIKFIWTLWEWILVLKKFSSRLPFRYRAVHFFFLILSLRKQ